MPAITEFDWVRCERKSLALARNLGRILRMHGVVHQLPAPVRAVDIPESEEAPSNHSAAGVGQYFREVENLLRRP